MKPMRLYCLTVAFLVLLGCGGIPRGTKTGQVVDVPIRGRDVAGTISVKPGDEVRWVNKRAAAVRVVLLDRLSDQQVSCKNHFGGLLTSNDTARLTTTDTASICFRTPGTYRYVIRMEMDKQTPEINVRGVIQVEQQEAQADAQSTGLTESAK